MECFDGGLQYARVIKPSEVILERIDWDIKGGVKSAMEVICA